jgi:hypothetical protein
MDVSDYTKAVRRKVGLLETDSTALPDDVVLEALNEGLKSIAATWEWYWLFATDTGTITSGDNTVALPEGYMRTISFSAGDPVRAINEQAYSALLDPEAREGLPTAFAVAGDNFVVWPTPNETEAYNHVYYRSEPELVDSTDEPLLPDTYSPWLVAEAALRVPFRTNSPERYQILQNDVVEWRHRAREEARRNLNAQPRKIRRTKQSIWSDV